jgi:hypothetical protein
MGPLFCFGRRAVSYTIIAALSKITEENGRFMRL